MIFKKYLVEAEDVEEFEDEEEYEEYEEENFSLEDIQSILPELSDDEIHQIGELIMSLIYEPEFEEGEETVEDEITEKKIFKTKKRELKKLKKTNKQQRRLDAKKRKIFYRRNKSKMKRAVYISKRKALINPSGTHKHV